MNTNELERYSFLWSEIRLVIAALALLIGGRPVLSVILPIPALSGLVGTLLTISWVISGVASIYLFYRWVSIDRILFGAKETKDTAAFFVSVISGINLGLVGVTGNNIGMSISSNYLVFIVTAIIYLASAWHLYQRWSARGQKIFG